MNSISLITDEIVTAILVESTAIDVIKEVNAGPKHTGKFWISAYYSSGLDHESKHATVDVVKPGDEPIELRSLDQLNLEIFLIHGGERLELKWPEVGIIEPRQVMFPKQRLEGSIPESLDPDEKESSRHSASTEVTSLDVSPQGGLYVFGTVRGEVLVGSTGTGQILRKLVSAEGRAHLLDTLQTKFFPSSNGEVILSSSRDMQIHLWSSVDGSNPRTFHIKHQALSEPPASIAMIGSTGRNFLAAAGPNVSMWECGSGELVHVFKLAQSSEAVSHVLSVSLSSLVNVSANENEENNLEFGTQGTLVLAVHDNSKLTIWNTFTKQHILTTDNLLPPGISITSILHFGTESLLASTSHGHLIAWNLPDILNSSFITPAIPLTRVIHWAISEITLVSPTCAAVCTTNCPFLVSLPDLRVTSYLTSFDSVAANCMTSFNSNLYVAGKAGLIYDYSC